MLLAKHGGNHKRWYSYYYYLGEYCGWVIGSAYLKPAGEKKLKELLDNSIESDIIAMAQKNSELNYDAELHSWTIYTDGQRRVAVGNIMNDSKGRFSDNQIVRTSLVVRDEGDDVIRTQNTRYKLIGEGQTIDLREKNDLGTALDLIRFGII